ncbi:ubiquitin-protein ligase E3A-like [Dendronephthya gigantea]|uniref:ubiquitin-protein ligase E3A-like n=1 Tax=Dendronephthya gigantea TaxID=151771 RepID=UPI00106A351A|nr:ubiquitin-protein ligase E3A-like [Dendronephthya gigantea]
MMQPELKVSSKPPLAAANVLLNKRHSLHALEPWRKLEYFSRRGSHDLTRREDSNSCGNLRLLDSKSRSASLAQLKTSGRTLSASNLAALSDSNLSIQVALPLRSYEHTGSESNLAKKSFEMVVKRYYDQLTVGCGNKECLNKFCASNTSNPKLSLRISSFVSIELATLGKEYFCKDSCGKPLQALSLTNEHKPISLTNEQEPIRSTDSRKQVSSMMSDNLVLLGNEPKLPLLRDDAKSKWAPNEQKPVSFLHKFFSSSPFKFLFSNESVQKPIKKLRSGSLTDLRRSVTLSNSGNSFSATKGDSYLNEKSPNSMLKSCVISSKVPPMDKSKMHEKATSPTLLDLQNNIENVDINEAELEEFEDQCVLEMSSSDIKELSLTHFTLEMLETSVANYQHCGDSSFIVNTIRTVFSSPEALNASFQKTLSTNTLSTKKHASFATKMATANEHCKLDVSAVRKAYKLLLALEPKETFIQPLQNSVEIHLKTLQTCKLQEKEISQLIIMLENPLVLENNDLLQTLCGVVDDLEIKTRDTLVNFLATEYDCPSFQRLVKALQKLLSSKVHVNQCSEAHIITICSMLETLHKANLLSQKSGQMLACRSEFYNHELSQKLDYKLEYEKWRRQTGDNERSTEKQSISGMSIFNFSFILEPASKVRIMHIHAMCQMGLEYCDAILYQAKVHQAKKVYENEEMPVEDSMKSAMSPFLVLKIHRDNLIEDTLVQVRLKENDLKKPLKIRYVGGGEEGLDLGGLQKEFFHIIVDDIVQPDYGMFTYLADVERMWINCNSFESDLLFELVGTLLALAIYNGIILDIHFPLVIYKKIQGIKTDLGDLKDVDPSLARSLQSLLDFDGDVQSTFCYTFQISRTIFGETHAVNLKINGDDVNVTNENRTEFVQLYVDYLLNTSIAHQFDALSRGFHKVCDVTCLELFNPEELELLICGSPHIDFTSIKESTTYDNGFYKTHPTIVSFWEIVNGMDDKTKKSLLLFVTGSDRVPLKGLSNVAFQIIKQGDDSEKLPTALTCFNQLMLPEYSSKEKLQSRLFLAIQNSKGFGLT